MPFPCIQFSELKKTEEERDAIEIPREDAVMSYYKIRQNLDKQGQEMLKFVHQPKYCLPYLQPGRLVQVSVILSEKI